MFATANSSVRYSALALMALMAATRSHHFGSALHLPDASVAVFFLAGLLVGGLRFFLLLLAEAVLIDYLAINYGGVSSWCVSPAYVFLLPTYAAMWMGGRYSIRFVRCSSLSLMGMGAVLIAATSVAFLISNGSFYLLSGRYTDLNWNEYITRVAAYYPPYLMGAVVYAVFGYAIAAMFKVLPVDAGAADLKRV